MKITKEEIKKAIIQEMLQEAINKNLSVKSPDSKLSALADFLTYFNRDKQMQRLIMQTTLGRNLRLFPLNEQYESQFLKFLKQNKVTEVQIDQFAQQLSNYSKDAAKALEKFGVVDKVYPTQRPSSTTNPATQTATTSTTQTTPVASTSTQSAGNLPAATTQPNLSALQANPAQSSSTATTSVTPAQNVTSDTIKTTKAKITFTDKDAKANAANAQAFKTIVNKPGKLSKNDRNSILKLLGMDSKKFSNVEIQEILIQEIYDVLAGK